MKWIKASERLPEKKGTYITRRGALTTNQFIVKDAVFNPKYDDTYIHQWKNFGIEWLDESPIKDKQQPITQDINKWIWDKWKEYSEQRKKFGGYEPPPRTCFHDGADEMYQLLLPELQQLREENDDYKRLEQQWNDILKQAQAQIEQQKSQIDDLNASNLSLGQTLVNDNRLIANYKSEIESLKRTIYNLEENGQILIEENERLKSSLTNIIASWDRRGNGEREILKHSELAGNYWSPVASLVDSSAIADARETLKQQTHG